MTLRKMKFQLILLIVLATALNGWVQPPASLSLTAAYEQAQATYPLLGNQAVLQQSTALQLERIEKSKLPTLYWKGQGTLQSETVQFPGDGALPIQVDLPLYSLRTYTEANYLVLDGGRNAAQQQLQKLQLGVDEQSLQVELNGLKAQVNGPFFGVLLLREQAQLLDVTAQDLALRRETLEAGVRHGAVLESEVDKIAVRQLEIQAQQEQIQGDELALLSLLQNLTDTPLSPEVELTIPELSNFTWDEALQRPEQALFQLQKQALLARESLVEVERRPTLAAFANVGVGTPNPLNFFDNSLSPYAMGGVNFSWKIADWGQSDRDRELLQLQSQLIDNQRETFEHNLNLTNEKYREDSVKLEQQLARDREIADLQGKILRQLASQLEHGVITVNDYLTQANAELRARQQLSLHELQLQQVKVDYLTQRGAL